MLTKKLIVWIVYSGFTWKSHTLVDIEGVALLMQLNTGASLSLVSETTFREHLASNGTFTFWSQSAFLLGSVDVKVDYKSQSFIVPLIVTLMGRNCFKCFVVGHIINLLVIQTIRDQTLIRISCCTRVCKWLVCCSFQLL